MLDVIPPNRKVGRVSERRAKISDSQDEGRVVELNWQLPARLRRPIKEDLERERRKSRQREAIVRFKRHPLRTELASQKVMSSKVRTATGVEQHTADVYQQASPKLRVMMPPYGGGFVRRGGASAMMSRQSVGAKKIVKKKVAGKIVGDVQRRMIIKPVKQRKQEAELHSPEKIVSISGERDVPFDWKSLVGDEGVKSTGDVAVQPPRRRFSLPLHLSVWPFSESRQTAGTVEGKKKVRRRKLII